MKLFPFFLYFILISHSNSVQLKCRDPDLGGTSQNKDRKFIVLGSEDTGGAGVGNLLIFFPAAFYFAAITGRDIMITDNSVLGEMCTIIHCGFPFVSQIKLAFPKIVNDETLRHVEGLKHGDFIKYMENNKVIDAPVISAVGYQSKTDWYVWFNTTVHCVSKITGCDLGDVMCAERHAYQRLIRGPFKSGFTEKEEKRISGVSDSMKHALLTLPHSYAPRLDIAIHLRLQFYHFENQVDPSNAEYKKEVSEWMNSSECSAVYQAMYNRIKDRISDIRSNPAGGNADTAVTTVSNDPVYIYLAADNQEVKNHLSEFLLSHSSDFSVKIHIMKVDSHSIHHVKNWAVFKKNTNNEGTLDLVFDWYALSLANELYAWRKGGTNMLSTFVHSAQKLSGTTERTDNSQGNGIGTRGYQLIRDKRGNLRFDLFWGYTFVEDYQKRLRKKQ
jgi:hypothetical protein